MSKLFELLTRLEDQGRGNQPGTTSDVQAPSLDSISRSASTMLPVATERPAPSSWPAVVIHRDPPPAASIKAVGIIFDMGIVFVALSLFLGICFLSGNGSLQALLGNALVLAFVLIVLGMLYFLLCMLKQGDTPGTSLAGRHVPHAQEISARRGPDVLRLGAGTPAGSRKVAISRMNNRRRSLVEELALANRILASEGVLDAYGNISARSDSNPNHFLLARPAAAGLINPMDIVTYDLNGIVVTRNPAEIHAERFLHAEIYRARPDVMAIVYCRAPELIPFSSSTVALLPVSQMAAFLSKGVPVFESRQVGGVTDPLLHSRSIAQALAETLGDRPAVLIRAHGAVVVGSSLRVAVGRTYYMSMNARLQAQTILLGGKVAYVETPESAKEPSAPDEFDRAWEAWEHKLAI
jgi:ribulose-5-phosphate 4-epimerase/fuculose-1-phosphate aldolase